MSRAAHHFRQSDLAKALKAAAKAGMPVGRIEILPDGRIRIIAGKPGQDHDAGTVELDRELAEFEAHHGES